MRDIANIAILPMSNISLTQFYGIELDEYACDTATLSLWLAEHQMNVKFRDAFGVQPDTLPLKPSGQIVCGNACRLDWSTVCPTTKMMKSISWAIRRILAANSRMKAKRRI